VAAGASVAEEHASERLDVIRKTPCRAGGRGFVMSIVLSVLYR
jgi:hypothetical protein